MPTIAERLGAFVARGAAAFGLSPPGVNVGRPFMRPAPLTRSPVVQERLQSRDALFGVTTYGAGTIPSWISTYPMTELTPAKIKSIHSEVLTIGYMVNKACLDEDMIQQDTHLNAVDAAVRNSVTCKPLTFEPADETELAQLLAAYTTAMMGYTDGFDEACYELLYGNFGGYALQEAVFAPDVPIRFGEVEITADHPRSFANVSNKITRFDPANDELLIDFGGGLYEPPPDHKFLTYVAPGSLHRRRRGSGYQVVWPCMIKNNAIARVAALLEIWGLQMPHGVIDANAWQDETKRNEYIKIVQGIGQFRAAVYADDMEIKSSPTPPNLDARGMHLALIEWCNNEISKRVQGETLTTQLSGTGSYNAAGEHAAVKESFVAMTERALSAAVRRWIRAIFRRNMGAIQRALPFPAHEILRCAPRPYWRIEREMGPMDRMNIYTHAVNDLGLDVDRDQVFKEFGLQRARSAKDTIRGKAVTVADGAATVSATTASAGVDNPKDQPPSGDKGGSAPQKD